MTDGERLALGLILLEVSGLSIAIGHPSGANAVANAIGWLMEFTLATYLGGTALIRIWRKSA